MALVIRERRHRQALRLSLPKPQILPSSLFPSPPSYYSPCINNLSDLQKVQVLGHGNGGTVYKVLHRKKHSFYALKVLRFGRNNNAKPATLEAEILKKMDSPYIVRCHAVFHNGNDLSLVMEYMEGGSLHDILIQHNRLPEDVICVLAKSVLEGLNYLHGMHIVHGDIKPSNLLVNENGEVKIADFGVSHFEGNNNNDDDDDDDTIGGTCAYMSPERFDLERWGGEKADEFGGDVWSLGVVMLECILGHFPFVRPEERLDWATLMCAICFGEKLEMPEKASLEFQSFVKRCLEKDWRKRATVSELLHHPFVNTKKCCQNGLGDYVLRV